MRNYSVLSVVGTDRPGIVREISAVVAKGGCSIDDSRMTLLGGDFAVILLLSGAPSALEEVIEKTHVWADRESMTIVARPTTPPNKEPESFTTAVETEFDLEMPDQPGILSRISACLSEQDANVEDLKTAVITAPFSGTPIFSMHVVSSGPGEISVENLRKALQDLPGHEAIEITIGKPVS